MLLSVLKTAVTDIMQYRELQNSVRTLALMKPGTFHFKTLEESNAFCSLLAQACPSPDNVIMGLSELFINAVEHGNLDIKYELKTELLNQETWHEEIARRLELEENKDKFVDVKFERDSEEIRFIIRG
ncbi:MAG: hypothetical protein ACE5DY_09630 [Mariprofundaceae bacterium]